ncbi:MAG: hexitol phosphatase HxpB [Sphingobacteriales bacterium]|nr:MAG: hexitol phosphatase HxpB [Sphingobacteriales bacterium]
MLFIAVLRPLVDICDIMNTQAAIFDMDGILIDSEPLWYEAANEAFMPYCIQLSPEEYAMSIGLRTKEFVEFWLKKYALDQEQAPLIEKKINALVISKIAQKGTVMPGVFSTLEQLKHRDFTIGLATSSPTSLIDVVVDKLNIRSYFSAFASAENLPFGKPHPQVYLNCAMALEQTPSKCICFEDSFNGLISAKSARMTCIAIPAPEFRHQPRFQAADLILNSLEEFDLDKFEGLRD